MVATVTALRSSANAVSYFEKDGYYAKDDPEHRDASFWHGGAAADAGLKAHVLPHEFEDVLDGWVPGTEIRLGRLREGEHDHRPGWDITFSAPKSVSLEGLAMGSNLENSGLVPICRKRRQDHASPLTQDRRGTVRTVVEDATGESAWWTPSFGLV